MKMDGRTLPREIEQGVFWLGGCVIVELQEQVLHNHVSAFLLVGTNKSLLVDTGHPKDWSEITKALDQILNGAQLDYIFPTHSEMPHAGNLPRLLAKYPHSMAVGDMHDYHLYYPEFVHRMRHCESGETIELGGREVHLLEAIIRDMPTTLWAFDDKSKTLFVSDGYSYTHEHGAGECALLAEERTELPKSEEIRVINERALYWTRYRNMRPYFKRLEGLRVKQGVRLIAPAHGNVIMDPGRVLPHLEASYT